MSSNFTGNIAVENFDAVIVGAGMCGLATAYLCALHMPDLKIAIIETQAVNGKKLAITGSGRCNLANKLFASDYYHSRSWHLAEEKSRFFDDFLKIHQNSFDAALQAVLDFWRDLGFLLCEKDKWYYPANFSAKQVRTRLDEAVRKAGVKIFNNTSLVKLKVLTADPHTYLLSCKNESEHQSFDMATTRVVLSFGGLSQAPQNAVETLLSNLKKLNIPINAALPALVQLKTRNPYLRLTGTKMKAQGLLCLSKTCCIARQGEFLFTKYGLSGIVSLLLSNCYQSLRSLKDLGSIAATYKTVKIPAADIGQLEKLWQRSKGAVKKFAPSADNPYVLLDLTHNFSIGELSELYFTVNKNAETSSKSQDRSTSNTNVEYDKLMFTEQTLADFLNAFLPEKLKEVLCEELSPAVSAGKKDTLSLQDLLLYLKYWPLVVKGVQDFDTAEVSLGGIDLKCINPETLELKAYRHCYAGGESLDMVGDCGGYNLSFALLSAINISSAIIAELKQD